MPINASKPVTVPGTSTTVFDQWYLTQLIIKADEKKALAVVTLNRSASVDGNTVLMDGKDSVKTFTLDLFKEMQQTTELANAVQAVQSAIVAYANKKDLI